MSRRISGVLVNNMELLEIADLVASFLKNFLDLGIIKTFLSAKHHYVIEKVSDLVFQLIIVVVLGGNDHLCTFLTAFLANLILAL